MLQDQAVAKREAALQALAERDAETSAGREAPLPTAQRSAPREIGAMEAAVRRQDSRVLLNVGGALFTTSRTTPTAVPGSMLEAMFLNVLGAARHRRR